MYVNSTNIPPIMIMNRMYENQKLLYIVPLIKHTMIVCISNISPMAIGCFICVNIILVIVLIDINRFVISGGILFTGHVSCLGMLVHLMISTVSGFLKQPNTLQTLVLITSNLAANSHSSTQF